VVTEPTDKGPATWVASLMELLLPRACIGCGWEGRSWCADCVGVELEPTLHRPDPCPPGLPTLATAATYSGSVRNAVLAAKERDRRELDRTLGGMLATAIGLLIASRSGQGQLSGPLWLVPVPASPAARRHRGRDHVSDWTEWAAHWLRADNVAAQRVSALRRARGGLDSVGLDASARALNLTGAFALEPVSPPLSGSLVVVVDDIVTTGATLVAATACVTAGLDLDPAQLGAAVVAATQRR